MPHLDAAYRFARWLARSGADAEDVVQDALLRAYRGLDALRGADAKAWLLSIVRNCHASAHRRQWRHPTVALAADEQAHEPAAGAPDPERSAMEQDEAMELTRLLANLSLEHREVLELRELEELSYREIAAVTRLPIGTVMSRLARARSALRELWLTSHPGGLRGVR